MDNSFNTDFIKKVKDEIEKLVIDRMDRISIHAHNRLSTATKVDTGQARHGWNFTLNEPSNIKPVRPKKGVVLPPKPSIPDRKAREIGDSYYLTNNVNHIVYLNEGTDRLPATNFIEHEVAQAVKDIEAIK